MESQSTKEAGVAAELLPCPFCGATAGGIALSHGHGYIIGCGTCQAQQFAINRADAIAAWNTRAPAPASPECLMADCTDPQSHFCVTHTIEVHIPAPPAEREDSEIERLSGEIMVDK